MVVSFSDVCASATLPLYELRIRVGCSLRRVLDAAIVSGMPGEYFPSTAKIKASYSYRDGSDRPIVFVGGVTVSDTKDRPNPPAPICGMDLANTSLGNGHIMALQLGGPDKSENIVPQYQQWQQSGRWRVLEKDAMAHCGAGSWIFVAHLHYGNTHSSGKDHKAEFAGGNTTIFWDDPLIPTIFDIWLIKAGGDEGKEIQKDILDAKVKDADREKAAVALPAALTTLPLFRRNNDQATEMPEEDRNYWRKNQLAHIVGSEFAQYKVDRAEHTKIAKGLMKDHDIGKPKERDDMMDVMMSPLRETEVEFVEGYGDVLREELDLEGWLPNEITQYGSNSNMLEAVFHVPKLPARTVTANTKRTTKYGKAESTRIEKRRKYAVASEPYKRLTETIPRAYNDDRIQDDNDKLAKRLERFVNGMSK